MFSLLGNRVCVSGVESLVSGAGRAFSKLPSKTGSVKLHQCDSFSGRLLLMRFSTMRVCGVIAKSVGFPRYFTTSTLSGDKKDIEMDGEQKEMVSAGSDDKVKPSDDSSSDSDSDSSSSSDSDSSSSSGSEDEGQNKVAKSPEYSKDVLYMLELSQMSKKELLQRCAELGITRCKSKTKGKLIELIFEKNVDYNVDLLLNGANKVVDNEDDQKKNDSEVKIDSDEKLADHWKMMEKRLLFRKSKPKGANVKEGRGTVRSSAWDHEHV